MNQDELRRRIKTLTSPQDVADIFEAILVPRVGEPAVVRAKGVLRARLDAMFADNDEGDISALDARDLLGDMIDTLLDAGGLVAGAGIGLTVNADGTVTVGTSGAPAELGIPSFVARNAAYVAADDRITADIAGVTNVPSPSILYMYAPDPLPRDAAALNMVVNTAAQVSIRTLAGGVVAARDLTPGGLLQGVFNVSGSPGRFTLVEPLMTRPPDWDLVFTWAGFPPTQAEFDSSATVLNPARFTVPVAPAADSIAWLGVPLDARMIESLQLEGTILVNIYRDPTLALTFNGTVYRWIGLVWIMGDSHVGQEYRVNYGEWIT